MKKIVLSTALTSLFLGSTALAGPIEDIVAQFQSYGYDKLEVEQTGNLVKIEGVRGTVQREIVYDLATSQIVKDETGQAGEDDDDMNDDHEDDKEDDHEDDHEDDEEDDHEDDEEDDEEDDHEDDEEDDEEDD